MKIHGTAKAGALSKKDFGVAFSKAAAGWADFDELKFYAKWDESSPSNIVNQATSVGSSDSLGNDVDIVITGATYGETGIIAEALSFDGTNDYGELGDDDTRADWAFFHGTGDWSINFWINLTAYNNEARLFSNLGGTETSGIKLRLGGTTGSLGIAVWNDSNQAMANGEISLSTAFPTSTWTMITWTCDYSDASNCYELFIDGESQGTKARSYVGGTGTPEVTLKTMTKGTALGNFINGLQDETSIWQRLLTDDEITELYNSGAALAL